MLIGILCEVVTTVTAASWLHREIAINHVRNACVCLVHGAKEQLCLIDRSVFVSLKLIA